MERVDAILEQLNSFIAILRKRIALVSVSLLSWNQSGRERVLPVRVSDAADWVAVDSVLSHWARGAVMLVLYCFRWWLL